MALVQVQEEQFIQELPVWLQEPAQTVVTFFPRILAAILVLLVGWAVGIFLGKVVRRVLERTDLDRRIVGTPIGRMMGETETAVSHFLGKLAKWFIYLLAVLAAVDVLAIPMLSQWMSMAVAYLPAFIAGLLIIIIGFILADFVGDVIERTRAATRMRYTNWFADGVRIFLYFLVIAIGLDTMGVNVGFLYIFAGAVAVGLGLGIALAVGIGFGWGSRQYIEDNIDQWARRAREGAEEMED